jgi:hypothetical protein
MYYDTLQLPARDDPLRNQTTPFRAAGEEPQHNDSEDEALDDGTDDIMMNLLVGRDQPPSTPWETYHCPLGPSESDKFPSIVLPTLLSRVKQAINGHLVRLTIKTHDLLWQAPRHDTR